MFHNEFVDFDSPETCNNVVDRRLSLMVKIGLRPAEIAWALDVSIDEIEAQLKILSRQLGGQEPPPKSNSGHEEDTGAITSSQAHSAREPLLEQAMSVLGRRIILAGSRFYLDGISASFRDLVVAAAAQGVEIPYPGLRPLPAAFHTGPSKSGSGRRKNPAPSFMSIHVPY